MLCLMNSPIKNNTDTMGFLLTITKIPENIEAKDIRSKASAL